MRVQSGFTLIELMITLVIAAILLTVGVPSFTGFIKDNRLTAAANTFVASINRARSEAIKRGASVGVLSQNGTSWENGWTIWVDADSDGVQDAGELVLEAAPAIEGTVTLTASAESSFVYDGTGVVDTGDTLQLCDDRTGETGREINIGATGRISTSRLTCL